MSIPATRPVGSRGWAGTWSQATTTNQREPSRLTLTVFTRPLSGRCRWTRTCPTPWKRTRVTASWGVESHRHPSPSLGKTTVSNRPTPRNRGYPGL